MMVKKVSAQLPNYIYAEIKSAKNICCKYNITLELHTQVKLFYSTYCLNLDGETGEKSCQ